MGGRYSKSYDTKVMPVKNLLYGLSFAPQNHERIYYFLLVDADKEQAFRNALKGKEPFDIKKYATIIASGYGDPPQELKEQMRIRYNAIL
jgi:hypothetical protein